MDRRGFWRGTAAWLAAPCIAQAAGESAPRSEGMLVGQPLFTNLRRA